MRKAQHYPDPMFEGCFSIGLKIFATKSKAMALLLDVWGSGPSCPLTEPRVGGGFPTPLGMVGLGSHFIVGGSLFG